MAVMAISVTLLSCGGGGGVTASSTPVASQASSSSVSSTSSTANVQLQGHITFDNVQPKTIGFRSLLDYGDIQTKPARFVTVELLDSLNNTITSTQADGDGFYQFNVAANRAVKVRARAALNSIHYSIILKDNTANSAAYVLDGSLAGSGENPIQTRNLHAALGWDSSASKYTGERQSAPFAILDTLYSSVAMVLAANDAIVLPELSVFWSPKNVASSGNFSQGFIGSSLYSTGGAVAIYVLGDEDDDTDEFDVSVLQHEFGHYIEDSLSRSESIGGSHTIGEPVDMRVAFGEGFGNAFASMSSGDPVYKDTFGPGQNSGFYFSIENNSQGGGYYNEGVVHAMLWDIFDNNNDAPDSLSLGFAPILSAIMADDYLNFDGFSSIYSFISTLKAQQPSATAGLNSLLKYHLIYGTDAYGTNETNTGGVSITLPVYQRLSAGQSVQACSNNNKQEYNGIEVTRFILLDIAAAGTYTIKAQRVSGIQPSDPDFTLYKRGVYSGVRELGTVDNETWTRAFDADVYVLTVVEAANVDEDPDTGGLVCFNVTLTRN
jgi:hypothetical protein